MDTDTKGFNIPYAPTDTADLYPDTDGESMAASDLHLEILIWLLQTLKAHFAGRPDVYVSGDILTYHPSCVVLGIISWTPPSRILAEETNTNLAF